MTYNLDFHPKALKEWNDLDAAVRQRLKSKLAERLENPRVEGSRLSGQQDRYKIKLKRPGIRLVYEVIDDQLVVAVIVVGKRENNAAYIKAGGRTYAIVKRP
ncbi:type II toxin-antitoxin system RelE family toxin [Pararhodobacter aggregans]